MSSHSVLKTLLFSTLLIVSGANLTACGANKSSSKNQAPSVQDVSVENSQRAEDAFVGDTLTASYQYIDAENDLEGESQTRWLRDGEEIIDASELSYVLTTDDLDKEITFEVQVLAQTGTLEGQVAHSNVIAVNQKELLSVTQVSHAANDFELWQLSGSGKLTLIKNIHLNGGSKIESITPFAEHFLFAADDGVHGKELWFSDGTEENTHLVKDINPGSESSLFDLYNHLILGDQFFFLANDGTHGQELWVTDGTESGTKMLIDIRTGTSGSNIGHLIEWDGKILFSANNDINGKEVWVTDGRAEGTQLLADINPGTEASLSVSLFDNSMTYKEELYFSAINNNNKAELWKTDGSPAGTQRVEQLPSMYLSYRLGQDYSAFSTDSLCIFNELNAADESKRILSVRCLNEETGEFSNVDLAGEFNSYNAHGVDEKLYVVGSDLDGKQGLFVIDSNFDISLLVEDDDISDVGPFLNYQEKLLVEVNSQDLWLIGDSKENTSLVLENVRLYDSLQDTHIEYKDKLFFAGGIAGSGESDMWVTDGTRAGTKLHKYLNTEVNGSSPSDFHLLGDKIYFFTDRYNEQYTPTLFQSDGTVEGTLPVTQDGSTFQRLFRR